MPALARENTLPTRRGLPISALPLDAVGTRWGVEIPIWKRALAPNVTLFIASATLVFAQNGCRLSVEKPVWPAFAAEIA